MARHWYSVLIAATLATLTGPAMGYPTPVDFTGKIARWNIDIHHPIILYEVANSSPDNQVFLEALVEEAAIIWSDVPKSYIVLKKAGAGETPQITFNFLDSITGGDTASGYAEFDADDENGPIHCSIHIAIDYSTGWESLAKTTLHEMGHCIGLGHSLVGESIMSYQLDKNSFALDLDDEAAASRLYPIDQSQPKLPAGCAISNENANNQADDGMGSLLLLCLPLLFIRIQNLSTMYKQRRVSQLRTSSTYG